MDSKLVKGLSKFIEINSLIGGVITVVLMFFISCDVIGRFFGHPIPGSAEIVEATVVVIIFLGLAWTAVENRHIKIDILKFLPKMDHVTNVITILLCFLMSYCTVGQAMIAKKMHVITTIWKIPRWVFLLVIAYGFFLIGLAIVLLEVKLINKDKEDKAEKIKKKEAAE